MAHKLKHFFSEELVRSIAADIARAHPAFEARAFVAACSSKLGRLELTGRARCIADAMHEYLPRPFSAASAILLASLGTKHASTESFGMAPFRYMPHVFFVEKYGLDDFETSMSMQHELTQRFSAEWSIRAFLLKYPRETLEQLRLWARDPNPHVRRLVSEGTRPRLPWAPRLRSFQKDPRPVLALLELLRDDGERYVQRSVANNLNDIAKDHPSLVVEICRDWSKAAPPARAWIVRHALRSLVKRGDRGALETLGVGGEPRVKIAGVRLAPRVVRIGGSLGFSFTISSTSKRPQQLLVDYVVYFAGARGGSRRKVFKLRRLVMQPAARARLENTVSFREMTTRRHYPGAHRIELLINGFSFPVASFELRR